MVSPTLTIIAGPNGAGKTTFAMKNFIDEVTQKCFVNADCLVLTKFSERQTALLTIYSRGGLCGPSLRTRAARVAIHNYFALENSAQH